MGIGNDRDMSFGVQREAISGKAIRLIFPAQGSLRKYYRRVLLFWSSRSAPSKGAGRDSVVFEKTELKMI
jgi:hypothetical protein